MTQSVNRRNRKNNLVCAEVHPGVPGKCDSPALKSRSQRSWANKDLASSPPVRMHRTGKMTPGGIRGEHKDCRACRDSLKEKQALLRDQGLALPPALLRLNPHPDYLLPFFKLILKFCKNQRHSSGTRGAEYPQPVASKLKKGKDNQLLQRGLLRPMRTSAGAAPVAQSQALLG